jgi:hypothetical protein
MSDGFCGTMEYLYNYSPPQRDAFADEQQIGEFIIPVVDQTTYNTLRIELHKPVPSIPDIVNDIKYCIQQLVTKEMLNKAITAMYEKKPFIAYVIREQFALKPDSRVAIQYNNLSQVCEKIVLVYTNGEYEYKFVPDCYKSPTLENGIDHTQGCITTVFIKKCFDEHKHHISHPIEGGFACSFEAPANNHYMIIRMPLLATLISK